MFGANQFTNPAVVGGHINIGWREFQPNNAGPGIYDWTAMDGYLAAAQANGRQLDFSLDLSSSPPDWVAALPGVTVYEVPDPPNPSRPIILPWDAVARPYMMAAAQAVCRRYDGYLNFLVMGGLGGSAETHMPLPTDIGLDLTIAQCITLWTTSTNEMIDFYASNLRWTPFWCAMANPYGTDDSLTALHDVVYRAIGLYGQHFGMMQWSLQAATDASNTITGWILANSPTSPVGFQMTGSATTGGGGDLGGTLEECLNAGVAAGAQVIQVYSSDCNNATYAELLPSITPQLAAAPPWIGTLSLSS